MSEWTVVTVVIALVGFAVAVMTPIIRLNTTITKLATIVEVVQKELTGMIAKNAQSHARIWEKNEEQDEWLSNHETRITKVEGKI